MTLHLPQYPIRDHWCVRWNNERGSGIARGPVNGRTEMLIFATKDAALDMAISMNYAAEAIDGQPPATTYTVAEYWDD